MMNKENKKVVKEGNKIIYMTKISDQWTHLIDRIYKYLINLICFKLYPA